MNMAVQKISRNDYFKIARETGIIDDKLDITDLNLSKYQLSKTTYKIVNLNFMEETINRNGDYMLRGHWLQDLCCQFASKCNFTLVQVDGYSAYAYSDEQKAIFTYCEGDITLTPYINKEDYEKEKEYTIKFYKKEY